MIKPGGGTNTSCSSSVESCSGKDMPTTVLIAGVLSYTNPIALKELSRLLFSSSVKIDVELL